MDNQAIVIEKVFNAPVTIIWKALSDKNEMKKWYFDLKEFKAEVGFKFEFLGGPDGGTQYLHLCEITEVIINKKLSYSWRYEGYEGNTIVTFDLLKQQDKTLLKLTHTGLESFPKDNPDFAKHNFIEGWNHIVNVSLKSYLESEN